MTDEFEHLTPDETGKAKIKAMREAAALFASVADKLVPSGPDKTHAMRMFRTAMFWFNHAISRDARKDGETGD